MPDRGRGRCFLWGALAVLLSSGAAAGELRDPTRPPVSVPTTISPAAAAERRLPILTATVVAPERRSAVIDGRPVVEGETIGGAKLVRIGPGLAVLRQGGREFTLRLAVHEGNGFQKSPREDQR